MSSFSGEHNKIAICHPVRQVSLEAHVCRCVCHRNISHGVIEYRRRAQTPEFSLASFCASSFESAACLRYIRAASRTFARSRSSKSCCRHP